MILLVLWRKKRYIFAVDYWLDGSGRWLDNSVSRPTTDRVYSIILDRFRPPDRRFGPLGALVRSSWTFERGDLLDVQRWLAVSMMQ